MQDQRRRADDSIQVPNVHEGDALLDEEGGELRCTGDAIQFTDDEQSVSVPLDEVVAVRVDADKSMTGFTTIGNLFGVATVLLAVAFVRAVFNPVQGVSIVAIGSLLSMPLAAFGAVWMRRLEHGEHRVLQLDHRNGARSVFITQHPEGQFERIADRITGEE